MTDDRSVDPWVARVRDTTAPGANIAETRNVTVVEQIEAEKALRESEARFRELADHISQFAWTADQSGWIYWYNKRWHDYTGTTLKEMEGWGWQKVHHPDHVDRVVERIRQSFETGEAWEDTFPLRGRDGTYRWFLSRALPIRNEAGEVIRWFGTNTDITEQIEAQKALRDSEMRFRELADNISQFAWTADYTGWIYWYNKRWHDYTGTTLEEMQGWGWQKVHHPDHVDRVVARIRRSFETGEAWEDTFPLRSRDGTYRWFLSRALPIRDDDGKVVRWFGTNTDITEQLEAEKALRELNETLEDRVEDETHERLHIWNVSRDMLSVVGRDGKLLSVNPAWTATLGWSQSELIGRMTEWLLHPDDLEAARTRLHQLAAGQKTGRFESRLRHKDGSYRWLAWEAATDRNRIYAMGRDITDLKRAEQERKRLDEIEDMLQRRQNVESLGQMASSIAHEIKQPLAAMVANSNAALRWLNRDPPDVAEVREVIESIIQDGNRAAQIISSVRSMAQKGSQRKVEVDLNELANDVLALALGEIKQNRVVLESKLQSDLPRISADPVQLQQVILNLVVNAVQAMAAAVGTRRLLQVRTEVVGSQVELTIEDSGPGIVAESINRIFEPFFTTKPNGMGMGLSICRSIVEAHGGDLSVSPAQPQGSAFRVTLPVDKA
jgi:PAS domain S-box-containing protein